MICDIIIQALCNYCITRSQMYLEKTQNQACLTYIIVKMQLQCRIDLMVRISSLFYLRSSSIYLVTKTQFYSMLRKAGVSVLLPAEQFEEGPYLMIFDYYFISV